MSARPDPDDPVAACDLDGSSAAAARLALAAGGDGPAAADLAVDDATASGDRRALGRALHLRGLVHARREELEAAVLDLEEARRLLLAAGAARAAGRASIDLGALLANQLGRTSEGLAALAEAERLGREAGDPTIEARALSNVGTLLGRLGRLAEAEVALRAAVDVLAHHGGHGLHATQGNLGYLLHLTGRDEEAIPLLEEALEAVLVDGVPDDVLHLASNLALARAATGDVEGALDELDARVGVVARADGYSVVELLTTRGRILARAGRPAEALGPLEDAASRARAHGGLAQLADCLRDASRAAEGAGDHARALAHERELREVERRLLDERAAAELRRVELAVVLEAARRENAALARARDELEVAVGERTAALRAEVEERGRAEERAARLAREDWLTGLQNRRGLEEALAARIAGGAPLGLWFIDLDRFKPVNDRYGHEIGDGVLRAAAARLLCEAGEDGVLGRFGGDEFVLVAPVDSPAAVDERAARLVRAFEAPLDVGGERLWVGCSVGAAVWPDDAADGRDLLRRADAALLVAKSAGRGRWARLEHDAWAVVTRRARLLADLGGAAARDELALEFQPLWSLDSGRCVALEALLRWHHPELGLVPPGVFIPLAEDGARITELGGWVLDAAARAAMALDGGGAALAADWRMALNVSVRQLDEVGFASRVLDVIAATGWPAARLELEVTESIPLFESATVTANRDLLVAAGVRFAIDDFGTGYASFGRIDRHAFAHVKVDRSLVARARDEDGRALLRAIRALVGQLGVEATAEGVETAEQLALLAADGWDLAQGYLLGRPARSAALRDLLRRTPEALRRPAAG